MLKKPLNFVRHSPTTSAKFPTFINHKIPNKCFRNVKASSFVLEHVKTRVVQQKGIAKLVNLRTLYVDELKRNNYRNDEFRADKLLKRLQSNPVSEDLLFTKVEAGGQGALTFWQSRSQSSRSSVEGIVGLWENAEQNQPFIGCF